MACAPLFRCVVSEPSPPLHGRCHLGVEVVPGRTHEQEEKGDLEVPAELEVAKAHAASFS